MSGPATWRPFVLLAGLLAVLAATPAQAADKPLRFATGSVTSIYHAVGDAMCRLLEPDLLVRLRRCRVFGSDGGVANLRTLRAGKADVALAQADLVQAAARGTGAFSGQRADRNLRVLFSPMIESMTVVAGANSRIRTLADLAGRRVDLGRAQSGTRAIATRFLEAAGIGVRDLAGVPVRNSSLSAAALCDGRSDAFLLLSGQPNTTVQEALGNCGATLLAAPPDVLAAFLRDNPAYRPSTITPAGYPSLATGIATVGVPALAVVEAGLPDAVAYRLTATTFRQLDEFRRLHLAFADLTPATLLQPCPGVPYHRGALRYLAEAGLTPPACR